MKWAKAKENLKYYTTKITYNDIEISTFTEIKKQINEWHTEERHKEVKEKSSLLTGTKISNIT